MKTHFDIESIIKKGRITNELDYDRALIADRKLRLLAKNDPHFKTLRSNLRDIIEKYERAEWSDVDKIGDKKLIESEKLNVLQSKKECLLKTGKRSTRDKTTIRWI